LLKDITIDPIDHSILSVTKPRSIFGDYIEYRLNVSRELAITPKISLVAVCCSSDSLSSWNSRTFSMAITA
jgi:hypothetical protein